MTQPVLRLPANTQGRDFVVGDIHGMFGVLEKALKAANFDPARGDRLISVGDLIDRGPDSHMVLHYLAQPWFHAIRGNHEEMFLYCMRNNTLDLQAVDRNLKHGFGWMLQQSHQHLMAIKAAFEKLPCAIEIAGRSGQPQDRIGFVHADVPRGLDWDSFIARIEDGDEKAQQIAVWSRKRIDESDMSGVAGISRIFIGHTVTAGARQLGNCFFVDTGGVFRQHDGKMNPAYYLTLCETTAPDALITAAPEASRDFRIVVKYQKPPAPKGPKPPQR